MERKKPLRAKPRAKGNRGELEVINGLKAAGYASAYRNWQSGGQGGGDVLNGPAGFHLEVKYQERCEIWKWIAQAEAEARPTDTPTVVFRRNGSRWYGVVPWEDLLGLIAEARGETVPPAG